MKVIDRSLCGMKMLIYTCVVPTRWLGGLGGVSEADNKPAVSAAVFPTLSSHLGFLISKMRRLNSVISKVPVSSVDLQLMAGIKVCRTV